MMTIRKEIIDEMPQNPVFSHQLRFEIFHMHEEFRDALLDKACFWNRLKNYFELCLFPKKGGFLFGVRRRMTPSSFDERWKEGRDELFMEELKKMTSLPVSDYRNVPLDFYEEVKLLTHFLGINMCKEEISEILKYKTPSIIDDNFKWLFGRDLFKHGSRSKYLESMLFEKTHLAEIKEVNVFIIMVNNYERFIKEFDHYLFQVRTLYGAFHEEGAGGEILISTFLNRAECEKVFAPNLSRVIKCIS